MALPLDTATKICNVIARQVRDHFRPLTIHYIVYRDGHRKEAFELALQDIADHPAALVARDILAEARPHQGSGLIGTALGYQNLFMGLASRECLLSLCAINLDQYENSKEMRRDAYHFAWHAIDALAHCHETPMPDERLERKRNPAEMAAANLRADAFAGIICSLLGEIEAVRDLGHARARGALSMRSAHRPEHYPFLMAMEAAQSVADSLRAKPQQRKKHIEYAVRAASEIGKTFDGRPVRQWISFAEPAQEMAWRGSSAPEILSAAIHTSEDTYVRATGYMVAEILDVKPVSVLEIRENYSPYADDEFNASLHEKLVDTAFAGALRQCLQGNSADAFFRLANQQNQKLVQGQAAGWCAGALQAAATVFEQELKVGPKDAEAAARREFDIMRGRTGWETLKDLGQKVVASCRTGSLMTMSGLAALCREDKAAALIKKSIETTMNDPLWKMEREAARDLGLHAMPLARPGPAMAAARKMAKRGPAPAAAPAEPALAMGGAPPARRRKNDETKRTE